MTAACLMTTYQPLALSFARGLGTRLWDQQGREYLDAVAGVAVTNVGHSHPRLVAAISEQASLLLHTSNLYSIDWQQRLARRLAQLSGLDCAFFNNSGAEANETALKLARLHGWKKDIEEPLIVVMENAFHGRTLGTMAASDGPSVRLGFKRLPGNFLKVRFGDLAAIEAITRTHGARIAAVLLEPIQGESGVLPAPPGYLRGLRDHCTAHGWLMMLDEIQTGIGRTGAWFAFQHEGIVPDFGLTLKVDDAVGRIKGPCRFHGEIKSFSSTFGYMVDSHKPGGGVAAREAKIAGEKAAAAAALDGKHYPLTAAPGPFALALAHYPPALGVVFGMFGELSKGGHDLVKLSLRKGHHNWQLLEINNGRGRSDGDPVELEELSTTGGIDVA